MDRFLVGAATLSLLAAAAERRPVLVVVDDLQWLDEESAVAVLFAARRLGPDAVAFLLAGRAGAISSSLVHDVPLLTVGGLPTQAAAGMLPRATSPAVVARLVAETSRQPPRPARGLATTGRRTAPRDGPDP